MAGTRGSKADRERRRRHARYTAAQAAKRRRARRRWRTAGLAALGVAAVGLLVVVVLVLTGGDDDTEVSSTTSTTSEEATGSAAGKTCVAVADPLPAGAPAVPVKEGPPPTQLVAEDLKVGDGATVADDSTLTVHYIGVSCSTGKVFDSSYSRGEPASFPLGQVIPGWQQGIPGMKVGGQRLLGIPPHMAYGAEGRPPDIAPDETLWFVVEVVDAQPPGASTTAPP